MTLDDFLIRVRQSLADIATAFTIYTERLPNSEDKIRDGAVYIDDMNPWEITNKETGINLKLALRFHLDRLVEEDAEYYESSAQNEAFEILKSIIYQTIVPGITLKHTRTQCFADDLGRYIIETDLTGYIGG